MTWIQRWRLAHYVRHSIWIAPVIGMVAALAAARLLRGFDGAGRGSALDPETVRTVLATLAASMFTFIVFVSSALLIAVQLASAQLSPRVIPLVFRDPGTRWCLTLFVFTFTLTLAVLVRISTSVPAFAAEVAAYSCLFCLGAFLYLIDHVGRALRPSGALRAVCRIGKDVIHDVYPRRLAAPDEAAPEPARHPGEDRPPTTVVANPWDGVILAFDIRGLVARAVADDSVIELVPQVGDFVAAGEPLFRVWGGREGREQESLVRSVAVGQERTMEQDPTFPFRIMVDIGSKALSPAINDPTTAVLAIDQIHYLLRLVGSRRLEDGFVRDAAGRLRLVYRTPNWEDYVHLAVTEIRHFGKESIQVSRRMRAMLENLIQVLPESRAALLRQELSLLQRTAERTFADPEDRALADISDSQGVGGRWR